MGFPFPRCEEMSSELCSVSPRCILGSSSLPYASIRYPAANANCGPSRRCKDAITLQNLKLYPTTNRLCARAGKPTLVAVRVSKGNGDEQHEIRVCTHRTCRKSGSLQTLELLKGLASPNIAVESCGCLGRCGSGPNLVVLPAGVFVSHCGTGAQVARLLSIQCGLSDPDNNLKALALKQQGNKAFEGGDIVGALDLFSQAINMQPSGGLHLLYCNRSAAWLANGNADNALNDAMQAALLAPKWHVPFLRQGEAYMFKGEYDAARGAFSKALLLDPSLRRSKSYQRNLRELESKLTTANMWA